VADQRVKRGGKVARPRVCARCKGPISESRPVFLVSDHGGKIVGPYHAGCAERVKIDEGMARAAELAKAAMYGQVLPKPDQEDEPW